MDAKLTSMGYLLEPSRYTQVLGYSHLRALISDKPTGRYFDAKKMSVPTFNGRFVRYNQITRYELEPNESFQACLGEINLETHEGESLRMFSLGGELSTRIEANDLLCELTSSAPIFRVQSNPKEGGGLMADEIMGLVAENKVKFTRHGDELYLCLSQYEPYKVFLACLVSLQKRVDAVPISMRRERYQKVSANLKHAIQIVREVDGWDGNSPSLEDLLSDGGD